MGSGESIPNFVPSNFVHTIDHSISIKHPSSTPHKCKKIISLLDFSSLITPLCDTLYAFKETDEKLKTTKIIFYNYNTKKVILSVSNNVKYFMINDKLFLLHMNSRFEFTIKMIHPEFKEMLKVKITDLLDLTNINFCVFEFQNYIIFHYFYQSSYYKENIYVTYIYLSSDFSKPYYMFSGYNILCVCHDNYIIMNNPKLNKYYYHDIKERKNIISNYTFIQLFEDKIIEYDGKKSLLLINKIGLTKINDQFYVIEK